MMPSTYESTQPWHGRLSDVSTGSACMNIVDGGSIFGTGIVFGSSISVLVVFAFQIRLFVISFVSSVIILIITHHSAGLNEPLKVSHRYIKMHIVVDHIQLISGSSFMCLCLYDVSNLTDQDRYH